MKHVYVILVCMMACRAGFADTITLKSSVRLPHGADVVKLSDIAHIEGDEAIRFADLQILQLQRQSGAVEIPLRDVRARLEEVSAHWGKIQLHGRKVIVRQSRSDEAAAPMAMRPIAIDDETDAPKPRTPDQHGHHMGSDLTQEPTVRGSIASMIIKNLNVDPAQIRFRFNENDSETLSANINQARYEIQPLGAWRSDRLEFSVRKWEGSQSSAAKQVSVHPQLRVNVATARQPVAKNHTILEADIIGTEQWLPPSEAMMAVQKISAVGRIAGKSLQSGDVLHNRDVRSEAVVKRGDLVVVRCLVGGVAIALQAEACEEGSAGESIEFRKQGERESFIAVVTNRGEAVLDLSKK